MSSKSVPNPTNSAPAPPHNPVPLLGIPSTRPVIYNSLDSSQLNVIAAGDPGAYQKIPGTDGQLEAVRASIYSASVAKQINAQRAATPPGMRCVDLEKYICDITIETSAQGASLLTVSVIDPGWALLEKDKKTGMSFIDTDDYGYLWPPIVINFPEGTSSAYWRLCQVNPSTTTSQANMTLVFEDNSVSELREHDQYTDSSCQMSRPDETRAEFIRRCIETASKNPFIKNADYPMRFIPLLPSSVFTAADLSTGQVPLSAQQENAGPARKNYNKQRTQSLEAASAAGSSFHHGDGVVSISQGADRVASGQTSTPVVSRGLGDVPVFTTPGNGP